MLSLSREQLTSFDLEAFVVQADARNQHHRETFTTRFPKAPSRWLSHDTFTPRPIVLTREGDGAGGLRWLVGATIDFSFTRAICAPHSGVRGGLCDDPASLRGLEVAASVEQYVDDARFCGELHQADQGRRYREVAGLHDQVPGQDDCCHCRYRVGDAVGHQTLAVMVELLRTFGLITGERLSTDGQLAPPYARSKGCPYAGEGCQQFPVDEAGQPALRDQWHSGAKRRQLIGPFPAVVATVRAATTQQGHPRDPTVALLESDNVLDGAASSSDRQQVATLLGLPQDEVPPMHLPWCHVRRGPQGELLGSCPKVPSDLEAKVGDHIDNQNPAKKEWVCGYGHLKTTDLNRDLGLALPLGNSTSPADAHEGTTCIAHRTALAVPVLPGQVYLGEAAHDVTAHDHWLHDHGGIAVFAYHPRNEHLATTSLVNRGYDAYGTPSAPCGRLCRSTGYDYQAQRRQYVCGRPCPPEEQRQCPHGAGVLGSSHRMTFNNHPRLIGPMQRGTKAWQRLYAARSASERTNSYDQAGIAHAHPLRRRGLKAFRFAGAIRTLAQLLRRALNVVRDVTSTLGKAPVAQT
jgi:hypothetical protein